MIINRYAIIMISGNNISISDKSYSLYICQALIANPNAILFSIIGNIFPITSFLKTIAIMMLIAIMIAAVINNALVVNV